jgi:hypothetical protein
MIQTKEDAPGQIIKEIVYFCRISKLDKEMENKHINRNIQKRERELCLGEV